VQLKLFCRIICAIISSLVTDSPAPVINFCTITCLPFLTFW